MVVRQRLQLTGIPKGFDPLAALGGLDAHVPIKPI